MTQTNSKTTLKKLGISVGVGLGLLSALISLIIFSFAESVIMSLTLSESFINNLLFLTPATLIYGGLFAFIPASVGGYALELLIQKRHKKGLLTKKWAIMSGLLLAGFATLLACGIGLAFLALVPHNSWQFLLNDIKNGVFFANLPGYIWGIGKQFSHLLPEIIMAIFLASISGGFSGKYLAKREFAK